MRPIDLGEFAGQGLQAEKRFWSGGANRLEVFPQDAHAPGVALTAYFPEERRAGDVGELGDPFRQVGLERIQLGGNGGSGEPIFGRAVVGGQGTPHRVPVDMQFSRDGGFGQALA